MGEEVEELVKRLRERREVIFSEVGPLGLTKRGEADARLLAETADTIESLRASLTRVEGERDALKAKHGLFPEEHAYMALLRLPITGALRATPEIQSAMATCVDWLAAFVGHEPQQVQEFYEERVALEDDRLSRPVVPEGK